MKQFEDNHKNNTRIHKINLTKIPKTKLKKVTTQKP